MELHLEDYLIETSQTFYALKYLLENLETEINEQWHILIGDNRELYKETGNILLLVHASQLLLEHAESVRKKYDEIVAEFYRENL